MPGNTVDYRMLIFFVESSKAKKQDLTRTKKYYLAASNVVAS
jgi:hypothetical protein